jgi:hypothetical protein
MAQQSAKLSFVRHFFNLLVQKNFEIEICDYGNTLGWWKYVDLCQSGLFDLIFNEQVMNCKCELRDELQKSVDYAISYWYNLAGQLKIKQILFQNFNNIIRLPKCS